MGLPLTQAAPRLSCLLVSYAELGVNSTEHVATFATGLASLGWKVHIAVLVLDRGTIGFRFFSCAADGSLTPVDSGAGFFPCDVVHVWTPRSAIWDFIGRYTDSIGRALILHLEDDEDEVLRAFSPESARQGIWLPAEELRRRKVGHLSHPLLARCLAGCADGVTLLSPELSGIVPASSPRLRLTPPLSPEWFVASSADKKPDAKREHTVVFAGGVHAAVAADFHALCRAVGMLVEKGRPVRLLRSGPPALAPALIKKGARLARNFSEVGFLPSHELASLLANATVLVQPGAPTPFNRRRFPAKLAPYLASGTPVVMPACYDWIGVKPGEHIVAFERGDAADIARAIEAVLDAPDQGREMGKRAAAFARGHFSTEQCCRPLDEFYREVLERPREVSWSALRQPRVELPLWLAAHPGRARSELRTALTRFAEREPPGAVSSPPSATPPLVTVVVPSFNHRKFLPERFRSIFAQTHRQLEVVVLDDASTDGSPDYLRALKSPFPLRVIANATNSGRVFHQWHRGVMEARGEFVWIAESDDSCAPELIEKLLAVAQRNPAIGLAYAQSRIVDEDGRRLGTFLDYTDEIDRDHWRDDSVNSGREEAARYLAIRNTVPNVSACLFRRSALLAADLPSISLKVCGDWQAYARICEQYDVAFVAAELNVFRRHASTAREQANRDGRLIAESYAVQSHLAGRFTLSDDVREAAGRSTFRELLHLLKNQAGSRSFVEELGIPAAAMRFDPRFRERLAGIPLDVPPAVSVRSVAATGEVRIESQNYHPWRWTTVRCSVNPDRVTVIPINRPGLVALRRFRVIETRTGNVLWSAESGEGYRQIALEGEAQRMASAAVLEIFSWGTEPKLLPPLPASLAKAGECELEFEIRLAGLESYEKPSNGKSAGNARRAFFILPHLELGGADRCNLDLIGQLTKRFGWEVIVVTTKRSNDPWQPAFRSLTEDVFLLPRFLAVAHYAEFIGDLIADRRPDIVYLSHSEAGYRLLPWLKESFPQLPVVDLLHLEMDDWKQGGFPRFSAENQRWLDGTIVTSHALKNAMVQRGCDPQRLSVVHTGIDAEIWQRTPDLTRAARQSWELPSDRVVILFAGRFAAQKSPELLPPIVTALKARGRNFLLVLAGDGPQRAWLQEQLVDVFPDSVRPLGAVAPDEMRTLMSAADVLLLPSRAEGIAFVLFEALSMGVVPVATDVGGQRELVTPECGRLVAIGPQLVESLVDALDSLLTDSAARQRLAEQGRERVKRDFPLDRAGEQVEKLLRECAENSSVDWKNLPVRPKLPEGLLADLNDIAAQTLAGDEWSRQVSGGRWLPTMVSKTAAFLRSTPCAPVVRRLEKRYGDRLGRWIISRSEPLDR